MHYSARNDLFDFHTYLLAPETDKSSFTTGCAYYGQFISFIFSSPGLIGELIVYPLSGVRRRPSVVARCPQCSHIFFSEIARPILAKFYMEPHWAGGTEFCSQHVGHRTKMAATPMYGKNPSKSSTPEPVDRFPRNLVCSIGDSSPS